MASKGMKAKEASFEERLEQLEALADKMEQGKQPLQEILQDYEAGVKLSRELQAELEQAKARMMEIKLGKGEGQVPVPSDVMEQGNLLDGLDAEA